MTTKLSPAQLTALRYFASVDLPKEERKALKVKLHHPRPDVEHRLVTQGLVEYRQVPRMAWLGNSKIQVEDRIPFITDKGREVLAKAG